MGKLWQKALDMRSCGTGELGSQQPALTVLLKSASSH